MERADDRSGWSRHPVAQAGTRYGRKGLMQLELDGLQIRSTGVGLRCDWPGVAT